MKKIKIDTSFMDVSGELLSKLEMLQVRGGSNAVNLSMGSDDMGSDDMGSDDDLGSDDFGTGIRIFFNKCKKKYADCKHSCYP